MKINFTAGDNGFILDGMAGMGGDIDGATNITVRKSVFTDQFRVVNASKGIVVEDSSWNYPALSDGHQGESPYKVVIDNLDGNTLTAPALTFQRNSIQNGDYDGVHIGGDGVSGVIIQDSVFKNLCAAGPNHTDMLQFDNIDPGASEIQIKGNWFYAPDGCGSQALTSYDAGTAGVIWEDNVCDMSTREACLEMYGDGNGTNVGSTIRHNTVVYHPDCFNCTQGAGTISLTSKSGDPVGVNTHVYDNITTRVDFENGRASGTQDHNMCRDFGCSGAGSFIGTPIYAGNIGAPTKWSDYCLAANSPGKGAASDGLDMGIRCQRLGQPSCVSGAVNVTSASAAASNLANGNNVCVTANIGNLSLNGGSWNSAAIEYLGTSSTGVINNIDINGPTGLNLRVRATSISLRDARNITIEQSRLGGEDQNNRTFDQVIELLDTLVGCDDCTIQDNEIAWTKTDDTGNTGYGIRAYGDNDNLIIQRNKIHDVAGDGIQGFGGDNVVVDRNEIGPVGNDPACPYGANCEHSDNIQANGSQGNLKITNNWIHHNGYWTNSSGNLVTTGNSGATYIHGGITGPTLYENNLIEHSRGRVEVCGLGTGGTSISGVTIRSNTFNDLGQEFSGFPGFEWDCNGGSNNLIERNIAVDPDGGDADSGLARTSQNNLYGTPSLVTLDADGNCTSSNCTTSGGQTIGYRCPTGVWWCGSGTITPPPPPDPTPPTVSLSSPSAGASVSGSSVTLSASASDNVGVVGVQFKVDGSNAGSEDTSSPYSINWDSTTVANGTHSITAVARDAAGNSTTSSSVSITVSNTGNITIGTTTIGPDDDNGNANLLLAQQTTLGQSASIQSLSFYVTTAAGKLRLGIYDATGPSGGPGAKVAETAELTPTTGWNTASTTTHPTLAAGTYWLAYAPSDNNLHFRIDRSTGNHKYYSRTYQALPATFATTGLSVATGNWSFYATLILGSQGPKPGDINNDNNVNITDLSLLLSSYNQNTTNCITNNTYKCDLSSPGDGIVNIFDLSILLSHYGT
jgi:hypothetical protein